MLNETFSVIFKHRANVCKSTEFHGKSFNPCSAACDYYMYEGTKCYCGDLDGSNPVSVSLSGNVNVYLKDSSKSSNAAFGSCTKTQSANSAAIKKGNLYLYY